MIPRVVDAKKENICEVGRVEGIAVKAGIA